MVTNTQENDFQIRIEQLNNENSRLRHEYQQLVYMNRFLNNKIEMLEIECLKNQKKENHWNLLTNIKTNIINFFNQIKNNCTTKY